MAKAIRRAALPRRDAILNLPYTAVMLTLELLTFILDHCRAAAPQKHGDAQMHAMAPHPSSPLFPLKQ